MSWGFKVLELAINLDHVHLFISAYPTIHRIVKRIKGGSSNILRSRNLLASAVESVKLLKHDPEDKTIFSRLTPKDATWNQPASATSIC